MNSMLENILSGTKLGGEERGALNELLLALKSLPGMEVRSVVLYGSAASGTYRPGLSDVNLLILVDKIDLKVLKGLVDHVARGRRGSLAPFFLTEEDVSATIDIFPLKYMAIKNSYILLYGKDFLADLEVKADYAMLRVRQRLMNMLLRMRRHYLVNNGQQLTEMMSRQAKRFIETLGILLSLKGGKWDSGEAVIDESSAAFGLSGGLLRELYDLRFRETDVPVEEGENLYGRFLDAIWDVAARISHAPTP